MIDMSTKQCKGRIYTDKDKFPHAMFEHYGTGDFREMPKIGTTNHFKETGGSEWYIPKKDDLKLNYPVIALYGNQFYVAHRCKIQSFYDR